jgi:hypothetical protein
MHLIYIKLVYSTFQTQKHIIHQNASAVENDIQNEKMIGQLKARVMQLQDENIALKSSKFNSFSVPDLSNPAHYRSVSTNN